MFLLLALLLASPLQPVLNAPPECVIYSCLYEHCPPVPFVRPGRPQPVQECAYGIAYEQLPDGPDYRRFVQVNWPAGYDPARRPMWNSLAQCESGGRWDLNIGLYDGGLQFHPNTWRAYGGTEFAAYAWQAHPEEQIAVAERVLRYGYGPHRPQGPGAWPHCSRIANLQS